MSRIPSARHVTTTYYKPHTRRMCELLQLLHTKPKIPPIPNERTNDPQAHCPYLRIKQQQQQICILNPHVQSTTTILLLLLLRPTTYNKMTSLTTDHRKLPLLRDAGKQRRENKACFRVESLLLLSRQNFKKICVVVLGHVLEYDSSSLAASYFQELIGAGSGVSSCRRSRHHQSQRRRPFPARFWSSRTSVVGSRSR